MLVPSSEGLVAVPEGVPEPVPLLADAGLFTASPTATASAPAPPATKIPVATDALRLRPVRRCSAAYLTEFFTLRL